MATGKTAAAVWVLFFALGTELAQSGEKPKAAASQSVKPVTATKCSDNIVDEIRDENECALIEGKLLKPLMKALLDNWILRLPTTAGPPTSEAGTSTVTFTVYADGSVKDIKLFKLTGSDAMAEAGRTAVETVHFPAFPSEVRRTSLTSRLNFRVNAEK